MDERKFHFETLDYLWTIAPFSIRSGNSKEKGRFLAIHKDLELHFVLSGREAYTLNGVEYPIERDHLVCVNGYVPHNYYALEPSRSVTIVISTDFLIKNGLSPSKVVLDAIIEDIRMREMILDILEEYKRSDIARGIRMRSLILGLVAYIVRHYSRERTERDADGLKMLGSAYEYVCTAIDYISENFTNVITLDELGALCGLSKYHLLRIFKQVTSHTPIDYINKVRCGYAKQLLLNGASVTEAATASGFSDVHYFSNCFKKYKGCRPSQILSMQTEDAL